MQESWRDIAGYEGKYQVSNLGNVRALDFHREGKIETLRQKKCKDGYYQVALSKDCKAKYFRVHRLVAQAFISNPENKPLINHINGIKTDNMAENLEWCTLLENKHHAIATGLEKNLGHENHNSKAVAQYDKNGVFIKAYQCMKYAQEATSIRYTDISQVCHGHRKTAGGYVWRFYEEEQSCKTA